MKIETHEEGYTDIFLTKEEVLARCGIGTGAGTCIWLMASARGMECAFYHRHPTLIQRWEKGLTVAKRDGCDEVRALKLSPLEYRKN